MSRISVWNSVEKDRFTDYTQEKKISCLIYKLTKLPNFADERFIYLGKEVDNRTGAVGRKQLQMIRGFHTLGENWAFSMRFIKEEQISLYLIFRYAGQQEPDEEELNKEDAGIQNFLMRQEYSFQRIPRTDRTAFELSWANEAIDILKQEKLEQGTVYPVPSMPPQRLYVPYSWVPADNTMEFLCAALMGHQGKASVEITLAPTTYISNERDWVNGNISRLKEAMNGEKITDPRTGRLLWKGNPIPVLKNPLDNCEKMDKQYESSMMFLSSIRVFSDRNSVQLSSALLTSCVRNQGIPMRCTRGQGAFDYLADCYNNVDISTRIRSGYWQNTNDDTPFRAQRLNRLVSVEEASNFFRIPMPLKGGFPGFGYDTGLRDFSTRKKIKSKIRLGDYIDEAGENKPAEFDVQQFAKHGLIVGVPGSGKTTAMFNILYQFWAVPDEQKIPFIILEPAKTEYRALKTLPEFRDDMIVFTLGDEGVSPFRFNPMEVLPGIKIESHISRLLACFNGAFDLFDPLPIFLEKAIRRTYEEKGWYDDSFGGEEGLETPTLTDLSRNAEYIVSHSGFDAKMKSDFQASLLERLNSLRRGSKGRMLDTRHTIPMEELMKKPVVLELDSLNGDEKSLLMMFLLTYVFEYCKIQRKSGSPLRHMLLVEEAHNLIPAQSGGSDSRANPKEQTIELFVNMLAEMRALGEGILIADQLPTAIAPQAVKQTNVKVLMRVTAKDDREEIGNTMDLNEDQMHRVVNFKTGHSYLYHEGEDRVRMLRMTNFKGEHDVEEPPSDPELKEIMADYESSHPELYFPYDQCALCCHKCNRRVRNQAESLVQKMLLDPAADPYKIAFPGKDDAAREGFKKTLTVTQVCSLCAMADARRLKNRYGQVGQEFGKCVYVHMLNMAADRLYVGVGKSALKDLKAEQNKWFEKFGEIPKEK